MGAKYGAARYEKALDADGKRIATRAMIGDAQMKMEDWTGAIVSYMQALEADPTLKQSFAKLGQAFQEKRTGSASALAFGLALVMVFLILAALYERWKLPWAVLLSVPFAVGGALTFVMLRGMENDIYFQIGLVVLIGLAAKNAILIAEFAMQGMEAGKSAAEAAAEAARLRFRPIVMTSLAFVLGVVPLVFSTGAGAAARRSMGTGVFGGMLAATFIATLFVPLFFVLTASRRADPHNVSLRHRPDDPGGSHGLDLQRIARDI